jgi:hypothetical protein
VVANIGLTVFEAAENFLRRGMAPNTSSETLIHQRRYRSVFGGKASAFRTFIRIYSLLSSELLRDNIKLAIHEPLTKSVMTYTCPAWIFAADTYLLKFQRLQTKALRNTGNFPRRTPVLDLRTTFNLRYVYDYVTDLFRQQTEVK